MAQEGGGTGLPVIDVSGLLDPGSAAASSHAARQIEAVPGGDARSGPQSRAAGRLLRDRLLDRLTGGLYRSTPHRVLNTSGRDRLSFPFFFDPDFTAEVPPLPRRALAHGAERPRWDGQGLRVFTGTYGDYLLGKVAKVFPDLRARTNRT
jgi:hypothetical protein